MINTLHFREMLLRELSSDINEQYVLLAVPHHFNAGDSIIWESELNILNILKKTQLLNSSIFDYKDTVFGNKVTIVFNGGGSFGDVWYNYTKFIEYVSEKHPINDLVIMPQSVCFQNKTNLINTINRLKKHKGKIYFYCRDQKSFDVMKTNFPFMFIKLLPDLALCWDIDKYMQENNIILDNTPKKDSIFLHRNDKELKIKDIPQQILQVKPFICDWQKVNCQQILQNKDIQKNNQLWDEYGRRSVINNAINLLKNYNIVYSDRLHAIILGALLNKEVFALDNVYGKTSNFLKTWLPNNYNIKLINS